LILSCEPLSSFSHHLPRDPTTHLTPVNESLEACPRNPEGPVREESEL